MSRFRLVAVGHTQPAVEFDVASQTVVGRDSRGADVVLDDRLVSRRHAEFAIAGGAPTVEDLGSRNGTSVNGERIAGRRQLAVGDRVQVGSTVLELRSAVPATPDSPLGPQPAPATVLEPRPPPSRARPPASPAGAAARWRPRRIRLAQAIAAAVALVAVLLIVAQLVLPGVAAGRIRDELARHGNVVRVTVSAFPAVTLLWGSADKVTVDLDRFDVTPAQLAGETDGAGRAERVRVSARQLTVGSLLMTNARLDKIGNRLDARATIGRSVLRDVAPPGFGIEPFARGGRLGFRALAGGTAGPPAVSGRIATRDGDVVLEPDLPFGGIAAVTVFGDRRVAVDRVAAASAAGGFLVTAAGRLR